MLLSTSTVEMLRALIFVTYDLNRSPSPSCIANVHVQQSDATSLRILYFTAYSLKLSCNAGVGS